MLLQLPGGGYHVNQSLDIKGRDRRMRSSSFRAARTELNGSLLMGVEILMDSCSETQVPLKVHQAEK